MKTILTESERGAVYNAKGDVLYPGDINHSYADSPSEPTVWYRFNTDGTTSSGGWINNISNTNDWVDVPGTAQEILDNGPWIGSSGYEIQIISVSISGSGGTRTASGTLSTPGTYSLGSSRTANFTAYGASLWGTTITATYTYKIGHTGQSSSSPSSTFTLECLPQSP